METSSLDSYQYFSHTLHRGEMPAGGAFQMPHLIPTWESMQMSFAFLFMHCLRLCLNHLTHRLLLKGLQAYISFLSASLMLLLFLENVCHRLGWMRLRCLSLMLEEGKGAHTLDQAQLRWERVWMCGRNPCSQSLLSLSCQCSSLAVKMEDVRVTVVKNFLFLEEVVFWSSGSVYRMAL